MISLSPFPVNLSFSILIFPLLAESAMKELRVYLSEQEEWQPSAEMIWMKTGFKYESWDTFDKAHSFKPSFVQLSLPPFLLLLPSFTSILFFNPSSSSILPDCRHSKTTAPSMPTSSSQRKGSPSTSPPISSTAPPSSMKRKVNCLHHRHRYNHYNHHHNRHNQLFIHTHPQQKTSPQSIPP